MKILRYSLMVTFLILTLFTCAKKDRIQTLPNDSLNDSDWLVPASEVRDGGPGKDGIPAISDPQFDLVDQTTYLDDNDLVLIYSYAGEIRIYPHRILDWHEIINDKIADKAIAITYCPLTGTASGWDRNIGGVETTFGVSGLLYNSNLIPYDRETDSNWSQMNLKCINGELMGKSAKAYQILETKWSTAKAWFPNAMVLTQQTGFTRNYSQYPYGPYRTSDQLIFSISTEDDRLPLKERVLGVINNDSRAKAYTFNDFKSRRLVKDIFGNNQLLILGSEEENYLLVYIQPPGLEFELIENPVDPSIVLIDNENNQWNIFGAAVNGPRTGEQLQSPPAFIGFWFSWGAFYPDLEIY